MGYHTSAVIKALNVACRVIDVKSGCYAHCILDFFFFCDPHTTTLETLSGLVLLRIWWNNFWKCQPVSRSGVGDFPGHPALGDRTFVVYFSNILRIITIR